MSTAGIIVTTVRYKTTLHEVGDEIEIPGPEWALEESTVVWEHKVLCVVCLWARKRLEEAPAGENVAGAPRFGSMEPPEEPA